VTWRRAGRSLAALGLIAGSRLFAQAPRVVVDGPAANPLTVAAATFTVRANDFAAVDLPVQLRLQVGLTADFDGVLLADTTVAGPVATIVLPRLLPPGAVIFWRAFALTARGGSIPSETTGPRTTSPHLRLLAPNNAAGQSLLTRRPTFVWSSTRVPAPLPGWDYELRVEAAPLGVPVIIARTTDTSFTATTDLEANTSYRWRVVARFPASDEIVEVASLSSFVIRSDDEPLATLLYQNFPNPFPSPTASRTCFWFDLAAAGPVELDILDLRGQPVRRIVPSASVRNPLVPGRYGRPPSGGMGGCDDAFTWDGTAANGREVPPGIYLVRFRAGGKQELRRVVFRGR
jgi:hypothetical protein